MTKVLFCKQHVKANSGGLEKYAQRLLSAFIDKGCEVTLATTTQGCAFKGVQSVRLKDPGIFGFQKLKSWDHSCQEYAKKHPHNLVFTLDRISSATHIRAGNGVHASYLQKRNDGLLRTFSFKINPLHHTILHLEEQGFCSKNLRTLIVNSHMVKHEVLEHYDVDPAKICVHHNGVEYEEMAKAFADWQKTKDEVRAELHLNPDFYTFLFVGHYYKRKGLDDLLHGLAKTANAQLLVVGKEKNLDAYRALIEKLRLQGRVHLLGPRSDMRRLYSAADAAVIPSLYDPFANVTVEALAMGLYVVSSAFNGGKEILSEKNGCVIEDLFDPESVASALTKAMHFPKTLKSAEAIRSKLAPFDFSKKLPLLIDSCLEPLN